MYINLYILILNKYLKARDKSSDNNKDNFALSLRNKEDISKTASILEERVFGKDLKNMNIMPNNNIAGKNITFRQDKEKEKEKEKPKENHSHQMNNYFNYNLLKPKDEQV